MDPDLSRLLAGIFILPVTLGVALSLLTAFILLLVSGIISASEAVYFSLSQEDTDTIEKEDKPADRFLKKLLEHSDWLSATIKISSGFINVIIIILCIYGLGRLFDFSGEPVVFMIALACVLTLLILFFVEIIPKISVKKNPLSFARKTARFITALDKICRPFSILLVNTSRSLNNLQEKKKRHISVDELSKALELTSGEIKDEKDILEGIIQFHDKTAVQIMTSRIDISALDIRSNFRQVIDHVIETGYSRIPVYTGSCDTVKGILYIKDLLPHIDKPESFRWQNLIRSAFFVPETKKIDDLLEEFRSNKIHLAIVVDEFGGTSGIVTLEDILEEIVGEISDEYDEEDSRYSKLPDGSYIFEAKTLLTDFFKITGVNGSKFNKLTEDVETLAGLVLEIKGNFPEESEILKFDKYSFQVLEINQRRISKVKFSIMEESPKS